MINCCGFWLALIDRSDLRARALVISLSLSLSMNAFTRSPTNVGRRIVSSVGPMATRMENTKKLSVMLRLPLEILVHIIKLVQRSPDSGPGLWSSDRPNYPFPLGGALGEDIYDPKWYNIMLVCSYLRIVAVRSPALWSYIDTRWPRTFINLCVSRTLPHPLQVLAHVSSSTSSLLATRLLRHARDAEIIFDDPTAPPEEFASAYDNGTLDEMPEDDISPAMWRALCQRVLKTASQLRSLTVSVSVRSEWATSLVLGIVQPILGGDRSTITRLDLQHVHVMDLPDMPYLIYMRLMEVVPPSDDPTWLQRWLAAAPNLRALGLAARSSVIATPTAPIHLPHFADFNVLVPLDMVLPMLATVPPPHETLLLSVHSTRPSAIEAAEATLVCVHAYTRQFVAQTRGDVPLSRPTLDIKHNPHLPKCILNIGRLSSSRLEVSISYDGVQATGPFFTDVARCTVSAYALRDVDWVELHKLTALDSIRICTKIRVEPADASSVQEWADARARAGCAVPLVEITHRSEMWHLEHMRVKWKPAQCTLAEAAWAS
jgi:hypothetical protein